MLKILAWIGANGASLIAIIQCIVKALKEISTAVINLISLILPTSGWIKVVEKVRGWFNTVDDFLETIKNSMLPK